MKSDLCSSHGPSPVSLGIAGLGGYARFIGDLVLASGQQAAPRVSLKAVCDPALDAHAPRVDELKRHGITAFDAFDRMLRADIEAVWLPVPIHLHRPFVEAALAAGKAVMVEKPAAGCVDDVDALIAARRRTNGVVAVGFQDIYDPQTLDLKRRILGGDIGRVNSVVLTACSARGDRYFTRNGWAGRVRVGGTWVLDSPANNALAHPLNLALFLMGASEQASADLVAIEAEAYRAARIESYDTVSARVTSTSGAELLVLLTHACSTDHPTRLVITGDRGTITWQPAEVVIQTPRGREVLERVPNREHMLNRFAKLVRGQDDADRAVASLEVARVHSAVVSAIAEVAPVIDVPTTCAREHMTAGGPGRAIVDIERAVLAAADARSTLHATGLLPFTYEPRRLEFAGYNSFAGPAALPAGASSSIRPSLTVARSTR